MHTEKLISIFVAIILTIGCWDFPTISFSNSRHLIAPRMPDLNNTCGILLHCLHLAGRVWPSHQIFHLKAIHITKTVTNGNICNTMGILSTILLSLFSVSNLYTSYTFTCCYFRLTLADYIYKSKVNTHDAHCFQRKGQMHLSQQLFSSTGKNYNAFK